MSIAGVGKLSEDLTSYDLLKSFALITMVIDHLGYYLYPDQLEWRVVGRMSLPVWMFLVGYARSRKIPASLVAGALILLVSDIVLGRSLLPLNILFTIALVRLLIEPVMQRALQNTMTFWLDTFLISVVLAGTLYFVDYGAHALLFAMLGYLVRHRTQVGVSEKTVMGFLLVICAVHAGTQIVIFEMSLLYGVLSAIGILLTTITLYYFRPAELPELTRALWNPLVGLLKVMGRRTLEIYVAHLLALKIAVAWMSWPQTGFFQWTWF